MVFYYILKCSDVTVKKINGLIHSPPLNIIIPIAINLMVCHTIHVVSVHIYVTHCVPLSYSWSFPVSLLSTLSQSGGPSCELLRWCMSNVGYEVSVLRLLISSVIIHRLSEYALSSRRNVIERLS